jgi:hypothetical protein
MGTARSTQVGSKEAYGWFFGAGLFAVLLTLTLLVIDDRKQSSTGEKDTAEVLRELRTAQSVVNTGSVDSRQLVTTVLFRDGAHEQRRAKRERPVDTHSKVAH